MPAPQRTVSSKDVAALAGVSQSTVSYVLSGKRNISAKTQAKVRRAMDQLGYVPDLHAQAMIIGHSHILGLVTEMTADTQGAELLPIIRAIQTRARERRYDLILLTSRPDKHGDESAASVTDDMRRLAKGKLVDAFIMLDIRTNDRRLAQAAKLGVPVVPYGNPGEPYVFRCVNADRSAIDGLAVWEAHAIGAHSLVVVGDPRGNGRFPFIEAYERTTREGAERYGMTWERFDARDTSWQSFAPIADRFDEWKARGGVCVYARSPRTLAWIEQMMLMRGVEPGRDIALIGECSDEFAAAQPVPVSNVSPEAEITGHRAVDLAVGQVEGDEMEPGLETTPPKFTRRATTVPGFAQ
ncbi:LacI family DNA-binding transcriptional regulator [Bifidobacterium leontopitheci]|uniref:LacI family transcriptional regulator n=1 Tax=Bifidobacterium leontopitheci TaxID=2650774 RepID=A0A6I1GG62_9BIFI|nr:LacI family DNA-binding transcriptional regulator [Bifidobacterium leontopitheci]KAB7790634.1 LacI family transcriptional regulator [Bifidobacterium leontopitheci]